MRPFLFLLILMILFLPVTTSLESDVTPLGRSVHQSLWYSRFKSPSVLQVSPVPMGRCHDIKVNVTVKFTLEQATKVQRGVEIYVYSFFNLGARWSGWSTPRPGRERPSTQCTGGWVGLRAGLDRREISRPHWNSIPGPSSP